MSILLTLLLAVSLSMDAFSLALIYGTLNLNNKIHNLVSITVGIFHFFMPILGYKVGKMILEIIKIEPHLIVGLIFILLALEMILSIKKETSIKILTNILSIIIFSFTVSIDSFSVGISFGIEKNNIILSCIIFSIISCLFTYSGLKLGKKLSSIFGSISVLIGSIILMVLGIIYLT